jgi:hypothetical protein
MLFKSYWYEGIMRVQMTVMNHEDVMNVLGEEGAVALQSVCGRQGTAMLESLGCASAGSPEPVQAPSPAFDMTTSGPM